MKENGRVNKTMACLETWIDDNIDMLHYNYSMSSEKGGESKRKSSIFNNEKHMRKSI